MLCFVCRLSYFSRNFSSKTDNGHSLGEKKKKQELKDALGGEEQFEVPNNALRCVEILLFFEDNVGNSLNQMFEICSPPFQ